MRKLLYYGGNIAEAIIAFFLYGVLEVLYFDTDKVGKKFSLNLQTQIVITALLTVIIMGVIFWLYKRQLKENNDWQFNERPHWSGKRILITLFGYFLIVFVQILIFHLLGSNSSAPANQQALNEIYRKNGNMFSIMVVVIAPFCEETIFRGMFFNTFFTKPGKLNKWLGILVSGFLFAYLHDPHMTKFILVYWAMGCVLGWVYMATKDLRYSMLTHMLNNLLTIL